MKADISRMFVAAGPRVRLLGERRKRFAERYVEPLVAAAVALLAGGYGTVRCLTV
jgi:hypothetical protein